LLVGNPFVGRDKAHRRLEIRLLDGFLQSFSSVRHQWGDFNDDRRLVAHAGLLTVEQKINKKL
jgi:hypothetical protein